MTNSKRLKRQEIPLSYDEFKLMILENASSDFGILEKTADAYDKIPSYLRTLKNIPFESTGIVSGIVNAIDQILSENKAEREQDNIIQAIYELYLALYQYGKRLSNLEKNYFSEQAPFLTYKYFELSKKTFESQKIEFFRNVWLNGLLNIDKQSGEKNAIFELAAMLTKDEVLTLKIFYDEQHLVEFTERKPVNVEKVAQVFNIEISYARQICASLQSRGLLSDDDIGKWGYKGPNNFIITDYAKLLVEYVIEPKAE